MVLVRKWGAVGPHFREKKLGRLCAMEQALLKFADSEHRYIIRPEVGTEFDHVEEAYDYYNMYSWERGFGIKWGRERVADNKESRKLPVEKRYKLAREITCSCSVSDTGALNYYSLVLLPFSVMSVVD